MSEVPLYIECRHCLLPDLARPEQRSFREREIFIDNLLVRVHLIIEMILVDRPCVMGV